MYDFSKFYLICGLYKFTVNLHSLIHIREKAILGILLPFYLLYCLRKFKYSFVLRLTR